MQFGECELDLTAGELRRAGETIPLEPRAFELLSYLARNPGRLLDKDELNREVWDGRIVSDTALSTCIKAVRQAIGDDGKKQDVIKTIHGRGFRFVAEIKPNEKREISKSRGEKPVIAVTPFANLSGDHSEDWFAGGLTADIIGALARHRWLIMIARNSMMRFKDENASVRKVHEATEADYIVEGNVRKQGERVRVWVQLIEARDETCLWSERFDREFSDIFDVQDTITQTIAARLEPAIGSEERKRVAMAVGGHDLRAWEAYHLGIGHFFKFTMEDNHKAQELLSKARKLDPDFGEAQAWWAYSVVLGTVYWDTEPNEEILAEALDATQNALSTDGDNAIFHALKARVQLARCEYETAIEGNKLAIELNPTLAAAFCGLGDSYTYLGDYEKAIDHFEQAITLSSNDPQRWAFFTYGALACIFQGNFEKAVRWADQASHIPNHQYWTFAHKAVALAGLDQLDGAAAALRQAQKMEPQLNLSFARERLYYLRDEGQLAAYLNGLKHAGAKD